MCKIHYEMHKTLYNMITILKEKTLNKEMSLLELNDFLMNVKFTFEHHNDIKIYHCNIFEYEECILDGVFTFLNVWDINDILFNYINVFFDVISGNDIKDSIVKVIDICYT